MYEKCVKGIYEIRGKYNVGQMLTIECMKTVNMKCVKKNKNNKNTMCVKKMELKKKMECVKNI